jgi:acylphosphatase
MNEHETLHAARAMVYGNVQGVGFRQFVQHHARRLDVGGWVRNRKDGSSVELYAEGEADSVRDLLEFVKQGPPAAHVEKVDVEWSEPQGLVTPFEIRR